MYTQNDIIKDLESAWIPDPAKRFPLWKDDRILLSGSRISLFADNTRWAIVFEKVGDSDQAECMEMELTYFGNSLINQDIGGLNHQFVSNTKWLTNLNTVQEIENMTEELCFVSPDATSIKIREQELPIEQDIAKYQEKGIEIELDLEYNPNQLVDFPSLYRYLNDDHPELFYATEDELYTCLPTCLPKLMAIDRWHHRDYYVTRYNPVPEPGTRPGEYETFPMLADVLVSKDPSLWKPTLSSNNHWRDWAEEYKG